jgi:hypothetical protein
MIGLKPPPRDAPRSATEDAAATAAHIVNGLTVRRRKQGDPWHYGLLLLPDFAALLILVGLGMHRLLRYLDDKGKKEG